MRPVRFFQVRSLTLALGIGMLAGSVGAQATAQATKERPADEPTPATTDLPVASTPVKTTKFVDLVNRYRFSEHYPREDGRETPGSVGPYRVGLTESIKDVIDQPRGAPRRSEVRRESVFIERATEQAGLGGVIGAVRFYERFTTKPVDPAKTMEPGPLDGLSIAIRFRSSDWSIVDSLTDRKPTDYEFEVLSRQMVVPQLALLLPGPALRLGDSWRISRRAAQALLGDPGVKGDTLVGKFDELRKEVDGPRMVALLRITGRITTALGDSGVNAEIQFTFPADSATKGPPDGSTGAMPGNRRTEGMVEARGAITEVRMGWITSGPLAGPGRLKFQTTREVTMRRQLELGALGVSLAKLPPAPKVEDPQNWLTWADASNRFRFTHPQNFLPLERAAMAPVEPGSVVLVRTLREGRDLMRVEFVGKTQGPEDLKAKLAANYSSMKLKVIQGEEGWLPEIDWPNRKVYRVEAAGEFPRPADAGAGQAIRIHFDGYLIQPPQAAALIVIATTSREPIGPFRREVEQILKTLEVDVANPTASR